MVGQVSPENRGQENGEKDENPAHGGGSLFSHVGLGSVCLDNLADLHFAKVSYDKGTQQKADQKGGQAAVYGSKGNIPKYI